MPEKQVRLETSAFLDSEAARALSTPSRGEAQHILEEFLTVCFDELGKIPRLLDGQDVEVLLTQLLPRHLKRKDPLADQVPDVLSAYYDHLEATQVVSQVFEIRRALAEFEAAFHATVRAGSLAREAAVKQDPFVHGASKLGRNDPCSCGSGRKYKKCHGRNV